ncbi:hypothetical protein [Streptomyces sp. NPDC048508]|uniref:hypothetical protein n=1 Tax=Streptomyces sp. NPDC048508 TaxID=3365561 RepID=UPI00371C48B2
MTRLAASLQLVLEGALVVVVLAVVVMGTQLSPNLHAARLAPASVAIAALRVVGLVLLNRAGGGLPWREGGDAPDSRKEKAATDKGVGTRRAGLVFTSAALATLVADGIIERSGEELFARQGLSGVLFGVTVLPAAHDSDIYLTALGMILTVIYMTGLIFRPRRQYARMGIDSITAVVVYLVGIAGLVTIAT